MGTKLLVFLALVVTTTAGPIAVQESDKCSDEICEKSTNFEYATGSTFTYGYRADTTTSIEGAAEDTAKLTIETTADIEVLSPCEFALRLSQTRLLHSDSTGQLKAADREQTFRLAVEASELRFAFHDGVVKHVCCGNEPEDTWVINFKKGVLSSFQNSMDDVTTSQNVTETDVAGTCLTEYKVTNNGYYSTSVQKTKDVLSCTGRNHHKTMLQMSPYNVPSEIQNVPIMKTTHECEQNFQKGGVLKTSTCLEKHVYRPFANGNSGATTTVSTTMTYKTTSYTVKTRPAAIVSKDSLAFDHSADKLDSKMARVAVEHRLREICDASRYDIRPESPRQFSELVSAMRSVSQSDLEDLHQLLKSKTLCSDNEKTLKFFLDALPVTNTDASIKLMVSLITSNDIKGVLAQAWITSLGFVQTPTSDMLLSVKTLIDEAKTTEASLLPVSAMVNNYCKKMTSCDQDYAVLSIMASLERNIGYQCDASGKNFGKVLLSLRAIGNAGHASRAVALINKCLTSESNPLEIRVAAAQAFRRMPCLDDTQNDDLWATYENGDLDSELRLAAYLALMRCPTEATLNKMAKSLLNEECDQVGAFVYSHLTNLRSTSDPHRQDVAKAAKDIFIGKEFELNTLKFSRNFEISALINKLNVGFAAESNVIWSSKSEMPRSISGNLTIDLFGQAINLMDFGARLEGLEYLVKNVFGPYMQNNKVDKTETKADDVKGSVYGRVFGNEMFFMNSETVKSPFGKMPSSWLDLLIQLSKKQDYTMTQSAQFMDVSMVIPTVAGLPIRMDVNGTSTFDLVLKGKLDVRKLGASPRSMDIDGEIRPSAAVEITGTMSVDAMVTKTGLRMRNTLHTSTSIKGRAQLERGMLLNVELDTPQEKMEVFSANSKFFILHNDMEQEQKMITENRREFKVCSGDKLATIAGLELCGELSFPNASMVDASPIFPMTGPTSLSVTLHKRDSHNSYKLFAKRVENKKVSTAQISFNTPGSKIDRAMLMDIDIQYPKKTLDVTLRTPWKKAAIRGVAINKDKLKSLTGSLVIDDVDTYSFTTEVKVDNTKAKLELSPMFEVRRVGAVDLQLTGYVSVMKPFKSADIDLSLSGIDKMPYTLKTSLTNTKKGKAIKGSFSMDGERMYTLEASHQMSVKGKTSALKNLLKISTPAKQLVSYMGNAIYRQDKSLKADVTTYIYRLTKKPANLKITLLKNAKKFGLRYDVDVVLKSSGVSGSLDSFVTLKKSGQVSTKNVLRYTIPKVAKNKISLGGKFLDRSTKAFKKYTIKGNVDVAKNPEYNMGLNIDLDHKKKHSEADIELKYGSNPKDKTKRILFSTSLTRKLATWKNAMLTYKMNVEAPAHKIGMGVLGKHQHTPKMLESSINLNYGGKGKDVSAGVTLKDKSTKLGKYNGKAVVAWPGKEYTIATAMEQKTDNHYINILNLKSKSGVRHTITTMYKMPGAKAHEFSTEINLANFKPLTLSGSTNLSPRNFELSGEALVGKDAYGFKTDAKVTKGPDGKATAEVYYPTRRMTMLVEGSVQTNKYNGKVEAAWDANNDKTKMITVDGSAYVKASKKSMSLGADMSFNSPFENFEILSGSFKYGSDSSQNDISGKFSWGEKGETISSSLNVKSPISLKNLKIDTETTTPFRGFRVMSIKLDHTFAPMLKTIINGRWDKENVDLTIEGENLSDDNSRNIKGSMSLKSTIKNVESVKLNFAHQDGAGSLASNGALNYEGKPYSYSINMAHSQNGWQIKNTGDLNLVILTTNVITSWKHKSSENDIKSSLSSSWGNNKVLINIDGTQDLINSGSMNGDLKINSPWEPVRNVELSLSHKHGDNQLLHKSLLKQGGKVEASSVLKYNGGATVNNGEFVLTSPFHEDISGKFNYVKNPMNGNVEITWAPKTKASTYFKFNDGPSDIDFEFGMSSPYNHDITGKINSNYVKYPMTGMAELNWAGKNKASSFVKYNGGESDFDFEFGMSSPYNHDITGKINSNYVNYPMTGMAELNWAHKNKASSYVKYNGGQSDFDFEFGLTSPYNEDITGKINSDFSRHPMTGMAELIWSPKSKAVVEGSVNVIAWNDAFIDVKMTTPLKAYRNIVFKASNKEEKGETVSHMNLDYGVRKNFDVESRVAINVMKKMFRLKMNTPFEKVKSMETGFLVTGHLMDFDGSADFELVPVLGKLQTTLNFQYDDKLKANFRVETPFKDYPYFELSTSSMEKGPARVSYISAEHYPRKVYRFDTTYAIDMPYSFEATIRSPFPEYDNLGVAFQHSQGESTIMSHGEVQYQANKKIEGDLNLDWSSNYDGSLIVKTPFVGYETSKVALSHKDGKRSFSSHGEVSVAEKTISADVSFTGGWKTTGTFTVTTPIQGYESVKIIVNKRGNKKSMRGNAAIVLNGKKSQVNFNHKMNAMSVISAVSLTSPYSKNFKINMDHNGDISKFTNKMSVNYGRSYDIDTIMDFDYRGNDISGNGQIKAKLAGPKKVAKMAFSKSGAIEEGKFGGSASYNREDVSINGAWNMKNGVEGSIHVATPFDDFKNIGATLTQTGSGLTNFDIETNVNYMDNKNINGKMAMSSDGLRRIRFDTEVATPFRVMKSSKLSIEHDYDMNSLAMSGGAKMYTTIGNLGHGSITYTKSGDLDNFNAQLNGKFAGDEAVMIVTKRGTLENLAVSTSASLNGQVISLDGSFKSQDGIDGSINLKTPFTDCKSVSFNFVGSTVGSFESLTMSTSASLNKDLISLDGSFNRRGGIDGAVTVKTPFDKFNNVGFKVTHQGEMNDFNSQASIDYMDNKNINGQVEFVANDKMRLTGELNTPRELIGNSKITLSHENYDTISTKGEMSSDIARFGDASFEFTKTGSLDDISVEGKAVYNGEEIISGKLTNALRTKGLNTFVSLETMMTPKLEFTIDHSGDFENFNSKVNGILGTDNVVSLESSMTTRGDVIEGKGELMYRTSGLGGCRSTIIINKEGMMNDFRVTVSGDIDNKKMSVVGAWKYKDEVVASLNAKTPFEGYRNVGTTFKQTGNIERFNVIGDITVADGKAYSAKLVFYKYLLARIETTLELTTPCPGYEFTKFEWRHESDKGLFKCYSTVEYGNSKKITYDMKATTTPNPTFTVTLKTPFSKYEEMMVTGSFVNNWPVASLTGKINAGNGNVMSVDGSLDVTKDKTGSLSIKTPMKGFTNTGLNFQYSGSFNNFKSEASITYMDYKEIKGKFNLKKNGQRIIAELRTPFSGYEATTFELKSNTNNKQCYLESTLVYGNNQVIKETLKIVYKPTPEMLLTIKTPFEGLESITASYGLDMTSPKYSLDGNVNAGNGRSISLSTGFDMTEDITGFATLKTPIAGYRNLGASFSHTGNAQKFQCEGKLTFADRKDITGSISFYRYMWRHLAASAELNTPFAGFENTKADLKFEDKQKTMTASSEVVYGDNKKVEGTVKVIYSPNYDVHVTVSTPFSQLRNVMVMATADMNAPSFIVTSGLTYNFNKAYSFTGKLNMFSVEKLDGSMVMKTPIYGLEYTKVEYEHKIDSSSVDGSASLAYDNGNKVYSAELQSTYYPSVDASLNLKTPLAGYTSIQGAVSYDNSYRKYETFSTLKVEGRNLYTMSSGLDYSVEPMRAHTKISTPYRAIRDVELVLTHEGQLYNFKSTGFLASPMTDNINAEAFLNYEGPFDMSTGASMKSSLVGMDDLKFELKNTDLSGEKKISAVAGWTDGQQIVADVVYSVQKSYSENSMSADIVLTTPFVLLRSLSAESALTTKEDGYEKKLAVAMNGATMLDYSTEYSSKDRQEASITFKAPMPMVYSAGFSNKDGNTEGDLLINWNKDDVNSNIHFTGVMADNSDIYAIDRSVDITVECHTRTMGVSHTQKASGSSMTSTGKVFWDTGDDNKVSYDLQMGESSRRNKMINEATLKLELPSRTLELTGSLSDSKVTKIADATFMWDAQRDTNKQVGLKAAITTGNSMRGDVTLSMPSIRKEIRVDGELMLDNGRIILDSKTDISYSTDSSKTLTLISKVADISDYSAYFNYSVELGVKHQHTNIDMKMNSHIGSSDERMTIGMETSYLTARRQTKNLALLTEINKLKKQISLQMFSPDKKIEIIGDVISTSPSKLRLLNRVDDEELFRSELTIDTDKKSAEINTECGTDKYSFVAMYPSNTEFQAFMRYTTPEVDHKQALLAVRLNTSRLLHSRIAWRPQMWTEMTSGLEEKTALLGLEGAEMWATMMADVADEIEGKYQAVTYHLKEEMSGLIDTLEGELRQTAYKMNQISQELRTIYKNNDFYVQNFGEQYKGFQGQWEKAVTEYRRTYTDIIKAMRQGIDTMTVYPIREQYLQFVRSSMANMAISVYATASDLMDYTDQIELALREYKERTQQYANTIAGSVSNASYVNYVTDKLSEVKNFDISPYVNRFDIAEEYSNTIDSVRSTAVEGLQYVWERPELNMLRGNINSIYQQGSWAFKYWNVQENLKTNLENIKNLMIEIIEDELKEISTSCQALYKIENPITYWAPEQGEIQAELHLPIEVKSLTELPDVSPLVKRAEEVVNQVAAYLPDQKTWETIKESVAQMMPATEEKEDSPQEMLKKYKPSKKYRKKKGGKRMRKYKQ